MIDKDWQIKAVKLNETGVMSWREIAKMLDVPKSTLSDYLRKYEAFKSGANNSGVGKVHLYIPDNQVAPGINTDYLDWIGQYIVRKQPDVIINAGDFADFPSLSSYDKGKHSAEGKRVARDIEAAINGMKVLLAPLKKFQKEQQEAGEKVYRPRMILTLGNHENRLERYVNDNPELHGFLSLDSLKYQEDWEVYPFLTPVVVDGIAYCHYFQNVMTGKPLGGTAANMIKTIGSSFTQGHRQQLDVTTRFLPATGQQQWGLIAGAAYVHDEHYKGVQGNKHWRGIVVKHNVKDGSYDPLFISMDWLKQEYSK